MRVETQQQRLEGPPEKNKELDTVKIKSSESKSSSKTT